MNDTYKVTINVGEADEITFSPQSMAFGYQGVDFEAGRTADGTMHRNMVAEKRTYDITLPPMHTAELTPILSALNGTSHETFVARFPDPVGNTGDNYYQGTFYVGDRKGNAYNFHLDLWDTTSFTLVEI